MKRFLVLTVTLAGIVIGSLFDYYNTADFTVGEPLFRLSLAASVPSFVIAFFTPKVLESWLKFAAWWLPLSVILIASTPVTQNSWLPLYSPDKETITWFMAGLFAGISLILIAWKSLKRK